MVKAKMDANKSKYSKSKIEQEEFDESEEFDENQEVDELDETNESDDFENEEPIEVPSGHLRSHGLFQNVWWKKGLLRGFLVFVILIVFLYLFDFAGLIAVENWKRWLFFLVVVLVFGLAYEKFKLNRFLKI